MFKRLEPIYHRCAPALALGACAFLPLKLSLTYACLIPLLVLFALTQFGRAVESLQNNRVSIIPLLYFCLVAAISALVGFDAWRSLPRIFGLTLLLVTPLAFYELIQSEKVSFRSCLLALIATQTLAATYTVTEGAFPAAMPRLFIGPVTESGQLAVALFAALALNAIAPKARGLTSINLRALVLGLVFVSALLAGFHHAPPDAAATSALLLAAFFITLAVWVFLWRRDGGSIPELVSSLSLPLMSAALLINLKRGPWLGVCVGLLCWLWFYRRRWILPALASLALIVACVEPIRDRLQHSEDHFFIVGGRNAIWRVGYDLAIRYPLGLGFENSGNLRNYSDDIPSELKHFHSNPLNILVETGWLGLGCYLWWILGLISSSFSLRRPASAQLEAIARALGCAVLAWQVAGIVEYNFGDSEVFLMVLVLIGSMQAALANKQKAENSPAEELQSAPIRPASCA